MNISKAYVATIQILIKADNDDNAMDGLSAILTDGCKPDFDFVIDWSYLQLGGQLIYPSARYVSEDYEEGDFVNV